MYFSNKLIGRFTMEDSILLHHVVLIISKYPPNVIFLDMFMIKLFLTDHIVYVFFNLF